MLEVRYRLDLIIDIAVDADELLPAPVIQCCGSGRHRGNVAFLGFVTTELDPADRRKRIGGNKGGGGQRSG